MSIEPVTAGKDTPPDVVRRLMEVGRVHHLPIVEGERLVGMWVATDAGPVVLRPDRLLEASPDVDALEAISMLIGGEAIVATSGGAPVGILSRTDALDLVRAGLASTRPGSAPPLVLRFVGPPQSGKTTLLLRTIPRLRHCQVGVIEANPDPPRKRLPSPVSGAVVTHAPEAHWRKGFRRAIEHIGRVDIVLVEDRDQPPRAGIGLGEDVQVVVVPAADLGTIHLPSLAEAQAVVLTKPDDAPGFDVAAERTRLRRAHPDLAVFVIGPGDDDPGMIAWQQWLEARLLQHRR